MKECVNNLSQEDDKEQLVSSLWGAERCLRVLDSVRLTPVTTPMHTYFIVEENETIKGKYQTHANDH